MPTSPTSSRSSASTLPPRLDVRRTETEAGLLLEFRDSGFERALHVPIQPPEARPSIVGSRLVVRSRAHHRRAVELLCGGDSEIDRDADQRSRATHTIPRLARRRRSPSSAPTHPAAPFHRGCADLHALIDQRRRDRPLVAAGVPWFLTLFGRDTLVTALMTGMLGPVLPVGRSPSLGALQADERDDWRDAEPGKLPHELRRGELARLG